MRTFLHIGFNWVGAPKIDELESVFNLAVDWVRYAPDCWIVWTSSSPQKWYARLKPHLEPGDNVFICELRIENRSGWLPKWVWKWINKDRG